MSLFDTPPTDPKFEDFVGEGKKYKTTDDAAKALVEKDRFIEQLKSETADLRKELQSRPTVDRSQEILDRLEILSKPATERIEPTVTERVVETTGLTLDDVDRLLNDREKKRLATKNVEIVKDELKKAYGPEYSKVLKSLAEKLGVSDDFLTNTAATSPQAFLRLVASEKVSPQFVPPTSSITTQGFTPTGGTHQKESFYLKLKETDKKKYLSAAVQNQMYKDAMALKEEFHDV